MQQNDVTVPWSSYERVPTDASRRLHQFKVQVKADDVLVFACQWRVQAGESTSSLATISRSNSHKLRCVGIVCVFSNSYKLLSSNEKPLQRQV